MKKTPTLEDKGGKPATKLENARHGQKGKEVQPKKSVTASAYTTGKKPKSEVSKHLETQGRKSERPTSFNSQAERGHEEEMFPEDFNRFGSRMTPETHTKPGL